jgi:hypothetical protein
MYNRHINPDSAYGSAHACSEIGLKWFLFALHDPGRALGFISVLDFSGYFVFLEHRTNGQNRIKTIFDHFRNTHARFLVNIKADVSGEP